MEDMGNRESDVGQAKGASIPVIFDVWQQVQEAAGITGQYLMALSPKGSQNREARRTSGVTPTNFQLKSPP